MAHSVGLKIDHELPVGNVDIKVIVMEDGERLGAGYLVLDTIEVEADDPRVRELLHQRLAADARAAGIALRIEASASHSSPSESRISRVLGRSTKRSAGEPEQDQRTTSSSSTQAA